MKTSPKPEVSLNGARLWKLPVSTLVLFWAGPGGHLRLTASVPGGMNVRVETQGCEGPLGTAAEAQAAVDTFIRVLAGQDHA